MKRLLFVAATIALSLALPGRGSASADLLARMSALNPTLHSYTVSMQAHVVLTTFPFLSTDLTGTYFHKDPDLDKLVITGGLPGIAQQFGKLYPHLEPPSRWNDVFVVTTVGDQAGRTTFKLAPRKAGNVDHIDAVVDDRTATISSLRWTYANGAWASLNNSYSSIRGNVVVTSQTGHVDEPNYKGDISSKLNNYTFNPNLPDSTFSQ